MNEWGSLAEMSLNDAKIPRDLLPFVLQILGLEIISRCACLNEQGRKVSKYDW